LLDGGKSSLCNAPSLAAPTFYSEKDKGKEMDISSLVEAEPNPNLPEVNPGDTVRVRFGGGQERVQVFEGTVIRVRHSKAGANFTVRQLFHGVGVERTFPLCSPLLEHIEILQHGKVRRAKLYYLRGLSRKKARLKLKTKREK
jgi:large subunit ribosomal protein L19